MRFPPSLILAGALLATACASTRGGSSFDPDAPPPLPPQIDRSQVHFTRSQVQVGDVAPDFRLPTADGTSEVRLSALRGKPVVLVFGSFT